MMGIYIPNMEKPKRCLECWSGLSIIINCEAGVGFWNPNGDRIPLDCPIIDIVECWECKHRDPEDKKCDCGMFERQGCIFPVADDYFCKYGERRSE